MYFYRSFERNVWGVILWSIQSLRRSIGMAIRWTTFRKRFIAIVAEMKSLEKYSNMTDIFTAELDVLRSQLTLITGMFMNSKVLTNEKRTAVTVLKEGSFCRIA